MKRLLKLAALAGAGYALWRLLRDAGGVPSAAPVLTKGPPTEQPVAKSEPANGTGAPTKAELYERAKELGIEGRSKMSKAELERAIRDAG